MHSQLSNKKETVGHEHDCSYGMSQHEKNMKNALKQLNNIVRRKNPSEFDSNVKIPLPDVNNIVQDV